MDMTDRGYVNNLKQCMHKCFDTEEGKEVLNFLGGTCCGFTSVFTSVDKDLVLMNDGKRQVYQTILTILKLNPDQIVEIAKRKEG